MLLFLSCYLLCGLCSRSSQVCGSLHLISHNDTFAFTTSGSLPLLDYAATSQPPLLGRIQRYLGLAFVILAPGVLARSLQPWRNMEDWCRLRKTLLNLACVGRVLLLFVPLAARRGPALAAESVVFFRLSPAPALNKPWVRQNRGWREALRRPCPDRGSLASSPKQERMRVT
ncbi:hypothetical protein MUK42_35929 [Musa troglodytarum]|uniref:Uncharacterized protein n=1 Tax=Musa troglodytarum TaxID=320322 RepID=A0A9E7GAV4_9LILI|nr:hypothetical protein MUK42_35929 [Musa troglodytarum]